MSKQYTVKESEMVNLRYIDSNGNVYNNDAARHCKKEGHGTMIWDNGHKKYVGEFKNGASHGQGHNIWDGLLEFWGESKFGVPDGQGIMEYKNGGEPGGQYHSGGRYEGTWSQCQKNGHGVYSDNLGNSFDGFWKNGMGVMGKYSLINGKKYSGKFDINVFLKSAEIEGESREA